LESFFDLNWWAWCSSLRDIFVVFLPCNRDKKYPETSNQSFVFLKFSEWNFPNPAQDIPRTFPDVKAFDVEQQQYLGVDENSHGGFGDMSSTSSFFCWWEGVV